MPNRILKDSIRTSYEIDLLSVFAETVFYRLITFADDFGRFIADSRILKSQLFPLKNIKIDKIINAINEITKVNLIGLYKGEDGKPYGYFINWETHQTIRNQKSKYPDPTNDIFDDLITLENICKQMQADVNKCPRNPIQSKSNPNTTITPQIEFDIFWDLYDKKIGDKDKLKPKWDKLTELEQQKIIKYIPKYKEATPDKKFRKHPETFLNNKAWNDEIIITSKNGFPNDYSLEYEKKLDPKDIPKYWEHLRKNGWYCDDRKIWRKKQ